MPIFLSLLKRARAHPFLCTHFLIWGVYFAIIWSHQFITTPQGISAGSPGTWSDGAAHLTYSTNIAYQHTFPTNHPVFYGHPFTYSFAADLLTAVFVRLGLSVFTAYTLLGFILSLVFVYLLYRFYSIFLSTTHTAILASVIFILSGGLGFIWFIQDVFSNGLLTTFTHPSREYTHIASVFIEWINPISSELIPQRSFLLGLPIGLIIITYLWKLFTSPQTTTFFYTIAISVLLGFMPIIHPHTLIVLVFIIIFILFYFVLTLPKPHRFYITHLLVLILVSSTIAAPLIYQFILPATSSGFFRYYPGWLANTKQINWLWFWFINWGIFPFVALLGTLFLDRRAKWFLAPFILIFILSNLFLFQPFDWDNSKLLTWVYLIFSAPAALAITTLFTKSTLKRLLSIFLFIFLIFSGLLDALNLINPYRQPLPIYTREELNLASWIKTNTSPDSLFLTSDRHNHPVPNLTGRSIMMGYRGWLWTYGIDYQPRQQQVLAIYSGTKESISLIAHYGIDYLVIGPSELVDFSANTAFFHQNTKQVYRSPNYAIYSLNQNTTQPPL